METSKNAMFEPSKKLIKIPSNDNLEKKIDAFSFN